MLKLEKKQKIKFNVAILGDSYVGKTSLILSYQGLPFDINNMSMTIGLDDYYFSNVKFDDFDYKYKIFDSGGSERYRTFSRSANKICDGIILVFDVTSKRSFYGLETWIKEIKIIVI